VGIHSAPKTVTALSQWENQDYVEKNRIEGLMHRVMELLLDIVRKATW
jgi:hypothetical protein